MTRVAVLDPERRLAKLARALRRGPLTAEEICEEAKVSRATAYVLVRALVASGVEVVRGTVVGTKASAGRRRVYYFVGR